MDYWRIGKARGVNNNKPIGVFDSGVGGLTVLRKLAELLPHENLLYLGDTARVPYGNKSPETIQLYAMQCAKFLLEQSVKLIVVACNTVSAVALKTIEEISHVPVVGMIKPGAQAAVRYAAHGKIGIIGTYATVKSRSYEDEIQRLRGMESSIILSQACPLFVPLAEEGWHSHPATYTIAKEYLTCLQKEQVECLILGCTHYPLLKSVIQDIMPEARLIDSGEEAAIVAKDIIEKNANVRLPEGNRQILCCLTDIHPGFQKIAKEFLGIPLTAVLQTDQL